MSTTPHGRSTTTYEGRRLPRPEEEVVDQGLGFDLGTLFSRRRMLGVLGFGAATVGLTACGSDSTSTSASSSSSSAGGTTGEIPDETAGPYPGDGSNGANVLTESGIVRSDITASFGSSTTKAAGIPLTITMIINEFANNKKPLAGGAVYLWHCDQAGQYSLYSQAIAKENYLRGVQETDNKGQVSFTTIFPACYDGRWPHIHFEVYPSLAKATNSANKIATSQMALTKEASTAVYATTGYEASVQNLSKVSLDSDNVFSDGYDLQIPTITGNVRSGYDLIFTCAV